MRSSLCQLLILAAVLLTYGPLFHAVYGFGDDFVLFFSAQNQEIAFLSDGRPLFALSQFLFHRQTAELADLWRFRFFCAVGVSGIAVVYFYQLRRFGGDRWERMAMAIALATLPCLQTYVAQAVTWLSPFAGLSAIAAAHFTQRACSQSMSRASHIGHLVVAALLMLITAGIYQPMLSWYWSIIFMMALDRRFLLSSEYRRQTFTVVFWGFVYFAICFIALKSFFALTGITAKSRIELTHDPVEKFYWLLRVQLPQALNFWQLMEVPSGAARLFGASAVLLGIISGFVISLVRVLRKQNADREPIQIHKWAMWGVTSGCILLLTHIHWLVIADNPQSYRIIAPLGVSVFVATYWAFTRWSLLIRSRPIRRRIRRTTTVMIAIFGMTVAQRYSGKYWIEPHQMAYRVLLQQIRQNVDETTSRIYVIRQETNESLTGNVFIECFARPAFERSWAINDLVRLGLRDLGFDASNMDISNGSSKEPVPATENIVVLDMSVITMYQRKSEAEKAKRDDSPHG